METNILKWLEQPALRDLPYVGHQDPGNLVKLTDGSLMAVWHLRGMPHELATLEERIASAAFLNALYVSIHDDNVSLWSAFVRHQNIDEPPPAVFYDAWSAGFDKAWREKVLHGKIRQNDWFFAVIVSPRLPVGGGISQDINRLRAKWIKRKTDETDALVRQIEDIAGFLDRSLEHYNFTRLALRESDGIEFSEVVEQALRPVFNQSPSPVPLHNGPLGSSVCTERPYFYSRGPIEFERAESRWGKIYGIKHYNSKTKPGMLDKIMQFDGNLVIAQSFKFLEPHGALGKLGIKENQLTSVNSKARTAMEALDNLQDLVESGETVTGEHHLSILVLADGYRDLLRKGQKIRSLLVEGLGCEIIEESLGNKAAFFAQLPHNHRLKTRPGTQITSHNFAHFSPFDAFPTGKENSHWGKTTWVIPTSAGTAYRLSPHVGQVGNWVFFGRTGGGKSTFLGMLMIMLGGMIGDDGIMFFLDYKQRAENLVRAIGGNYLAVRAGVSSGLAPLKGLANTGPNREFLVRWFTALIETDGDDPLTAEQKTVLAAGVGYIMDLPVKQRSILGLRFFLGFEHGGLGARLLPWCRGQALGWMYDGDVDGVDVRARCVGFDLTSVMDNPAVIASAAQYILFRMYSVIDGRRGALLIEEAQLHLGHPAFQNMAKDAYLRFRGNNWWVGLVYQQPESIGDGDLETTIFQQSFSKGFFRNPQADHDIYVGKLGISEGAFRAIKTGILPGEHKLVLYQDDEAVILNPDISVLPGHLKILSGRAETLPIAEAIRAKWTEEFMQEEAAE